MTFSSAGSSDPEGQPLSYSWTFGDNTTSTAANPTHTYSQPGQYSARLTVSDGSQHDLDRTDHPGGQPANGNRLVTAGRRFFVAGDVISFSGEGTDPDDGTLPASAFTWNIDFLHEGHVHPGGPINGVKSGTFTIPTSGHDFSGNTRYRIALTVTDSTGLTATQSVIIYPRKVNLSFHGTERTDALHRRGREDRAVRLRHLDRLQPHDQRAEPVERRDLVPVRLLVGRGSSDPYARRAGDEPGLHRDLPGYVGPRPRGCVFV